jgi:enamine deaminase RidA (YjgF/YER057c/UK114 family)
MTRNILILLAIPLAVGLVSAVVIAQGRGGPQIKRMNPSALSTPTGYTHVVEVGGPVKTIYIAGQVALDKDGKLVGGTDMKAQAEQVFENLRVALSAAGATFNDVVKMNTFTTDMSQAQAIRDVRTRYFTGFTPASTLVQVVHLARPELMLEVEVIAAVPESPRLVPASR